MTVHNNYVFGILTALLECFNGIREAEQKNSLEYFVLKTTCTYNVKTSIRRFMLVVSTFHSHFYGIPPTLLHTYTRTQNDFIVLHGVYRKMDIELICDESKSVGSYDFAFDKESNLHYVSNVFH